MMAPQTAEYFYFCRTVLPKRVCSNPRFHIVLCRKIMMCLKNSQMLQFLFHIASLVDCVKHCGCKFPRVILSVQNSKFILNEQAYRDMIKCPITSSILVQLEEYYNTHVFGICQYACILCRTYYGNRICYGTLVRKARILREVLGKDEIFVIIIQLIQLG